jgi:hypothetical protein
MPARLASVAATLVRSISLEREVMDVPLIGAILSAVVVAVLGDALARWINSSMLDRITKLTDLRAEIATALIVYANLYTNPMSEETRRLLPESERKRMAEGSELFRKFAAELTGRRLAIQSPAPRLKPGACPQHVATVSWASGRGDNRTCTA